MYVCLAMLFMFKVSWHTEFREQCLTLSLLMKELAKVKWQWRTLGIQIGVDPKKVKEFEDYTQDVKY